MPDGRICYLEIPAADIAASAKFYADVFGWNIRTRSDGQRAFDDSSGAVSGSWVPGRRPASEPGVLVYVMVDSIPATLQRASAAGGRVSTPITSLGASGDAYATILDPAGNLIGLYQERRR
jgi:predicted enzyme related to lactoylglutathione lyase